MNEAYIVDVVRLPRAVAKADGAYAHLSPVELLNPLFNALVERQSINPVEIEDVLLGCSTQSKEQGANLAKIAALYAGLPDSVSGVTLNRFCCSGQDAINLAAAKVMSGMESLVIAGGVEQLSRVPMFSDKGAWFSDPKVMSKTRFMHMGLAADLIAVQHGYEREQLDQLSMVSHHRALAAIEQGHFDRSLVTIKANDGQAILQQDNAVRPNVSMNSLAKLPAAFADAVEFSQKLVAKEFPGTVLEARHSAANAPALVDGASLALIASKQRCEELGLKAKARIRHFSNASDNAVKMLTGHIRATEKMFNATGLQPSDIDLWEVNESFAASVMLYQETFGISSGRLNIDGSAISLGHPLGATGGNLLATLLDGLERSDKKLGVVSICGGAGVGTTTLVERI